MSKIKLWLQLFNEWSKDKWYDANAVDLVGITREAFKAGWDARDAADDMEVERNGI